MRRREFITLVGGAAAWPCVARAQSEKPVVGWLGLTSESGEAEMISAFRKGLGEAGFDEGRVGIEFRFAEGNVGRLPALADELRAKSALLLTGTTAAALAAKKATSKYPSCSSSVQIPLDRAWWIRSIIPEAILRVSVSSRTKWRANG